MKTLFFLLLWLPTFAQASFTLTAEGQLILNAPTRYEPYVGPDYEIDEKGCIHPKVPCPPSYPKQSYWNGYSWQKAEGQCYPLIGICPIKDFEKLPLGIDSIIPKSNLLIDPIFTIPSRQIDLLIMCKDTTLHLYPSGEAWMTFRGGENTERINPETFRIIYFGFQQQAAQLEAAERATERWETLYENLLLSSEMCCQQLKYKGRKAKKKSKTIKSTEIDH